MSFRNLTLTAIVTLAGTSLAYAQDFGQCAERVTHLQQGKTAIATFHEAWFVPNRNWLKDDYPAAMVVSPEFGIEAANTGPTKEFSEYENVWTSSQMGWYVVAEPAAVGSSSKHAFLPLYLFSDAEKCHELIADWWVEVDDLPPEMRAMLE